MSNMATCLHLKKKNRCRKVEEHNTEHRGACSIFWVEHVGQTEIRVLKSLLYTSRV